MLSMETSIVLCYFSLAFNIYDIYICQYKHIEFSIRKSIFVYTVHILSMIQLSVMFFHGILYSFVLFLMYDLIVFNMHLEQIYIFIGKSFLLNILLSIAPKSMGLLSHTKLLLAG